MPALREHCNTIDWDARLAQVARQAKALGADLPEPAADDLHRRLQERTNLELQMRLGLLHAQAREAVAKAMRRALAAGSLLAGARGCLSPEAFATLVKAANITPGTAANYVRGAECAPQLAAHCHRKCFGRRRRLWRGVSYRAECSEMARLFDGGVDALMTLADDALGRIMELIENDAEKGAGDVAGR